MASLLRLAKPPDRRRLLERLDGDRRAARDRRRRPARARRHLGRRLRRHPARELHQPAADDGADVRRRRRRDRVPRAVPLIGGERLEGDVYQVADEADRARVDGEARGKQIVNSRVRSRRPDEFLSARGAPPSRAVRFARRTPHRATKLSNASGGNSSSDRTNDVGVELLGPTDPDRSHPAGAARPRRRRRHLRRRCSAPARTASRSAARRNTCGSGFPMVTSSAATMASKKRSRSSTRSMTSTFCRGADDAIACRQPS